MATTEAQQGRRGPIPVLDYDYTLVESVNAHQEILDELREKHPFFWSTFAQGFWVLTRDEAIRARIRNPGALLQHGHECAYEPDPPYLWIPEQLDPPEHARCGGSCSASTFCSGGHRTRMEGISAGAVSS